MAKSLNQMDEHELRIESLKKKKNGCATKRALQAQKMLYEKERYPDDMFIENFYDENVVLDLQYEGIPKQE